MDKKLFIQAIVKYLLGIRLFSILLFVPAGTIRYWTAELIYEHLDRWSVVLIGDENIEGMAATIRYKKMETSKTG